MSGTHAACMGDRDLLVVPAHLREQLRDVVRSDLASRDVVDELIAERRAAAEAEDR